MPDLPELYEALDNELARLNLIDPFAHDEQWKYQLEKSQRVLALCAAIEAKQTQERDELLNDGWGDVPEDNVYRQWYETTKKAWDKRKEEAARPVEETLMGEILDENLIGDLKCEFAEIDGRNVKEFLQKLEKLMIEYRVSKVDLCFKPNWKSLDA